jgi:hypothetical protein
MNLTSTQEIIDKKANCVWHLLHVVMKNPN